MGKKEGGLGYDFSDYRGNWVALSGNWTWSIHYDDFERGGKDEAGAGIFVAFFGIVLILGTGIWTVGFYTARCNDLVRLQTISETIEIYEQTYLDTYGLLGGVVDLDLEDQWESLERYKIKSKISDRYREYRDLVYAYNDTLFSLRSKNNNFFFSMLTPSVPGEFSPIVSISSRG